jgi:hypothetical protein
MPVEKTKEDRLKEGITILKKLRTVGIDSDDSGSKQIQQHISNWVNTGEELPLTIVPFARYDRNAHISLPKFTGSSANIVLKVIDPEAYMA